MKPQPYIFKGTDIDTILSLGYSFSGIDTKDFENFMNRNYLGFNLAQLLRQVEQLMAPHSATTLTRLISVDLKNMHVELYNLYNGIEDAALIFDRIFYRESGYIIVMHEYLVLPVPARNQGLSKKILKASLQQYINMNVRMVYLTAGLSSGAYIWAKHGFTALHRTEMNNIMQRAKAKLTEQQYSAIQAVYNAYYDNLPKGDAFPIHQWADMEFMRFVLMDSESQWDGRLDLWNEKQLRKFEYYVSKEKT